MSETEEVLALMILSEVGSDDKNEKHKKKATKRKRRLWVKERNEETYSNAKLLKKIKEENVKDYKDSMRINDVLFDKLLDKVSPLITKQDTLMREAITAATRLSVTLHFLAKGIDFEDLTCFYAASAQSIGNIIIETCGAIIEVLKDYIKLPQTSEEWLKEAKQFEKTTGFPHCLGAVAVKHIQIKKPQHSGASYYNYNKRFSIILMAVVNADYKFLIVDVGQNGGVPDDDAFANSTFAEMLENNLLKIPEPAEVLPGTGELPFAFVTDDAFLFRKYLVKPYSGKKLTCEQKIFNEKLSSARKKVEDAFEILVRRFKILSKCINLNPEKTGKIVLACCYLHNFLASRNECYIRNSEEIVESRTQTQLECEATVSRDPTCVAMTVRDNFCSIINSRLQ